MTTRIKEARQARGWSQQELAERVRVSQPTIVHWEQGTHAPRHLALMRLADALGVSRVWLQGDEPHAEDAAVAPVLDNAAHNYLTRPIHHVAIFEGKMDINELEASLNGRRAPVSYATIPGPVGKPFAIYVDDDAVRREFPRGTIAVIDCEDRTLIDGSYYLALIEGIGRLRRWRSTPPRLEADTIEETIFMSDKPQIFGRVISSIRSY
jgi:transcriptional regulator with XRE-family HTH domain